MQAILLLLYYDFVKLLYITEKTGVETHSLLE
jgi:hypothetical protein